jgi:hypothetical protein
MSDIERYDFLPSARLCCGIEPGRSIGKCPNVLALSSITNHGLWDTIPRRRMGWSRPGEIRLSYHGRKSCRIQRRNTCRNCWAVPRTRRSAASERRVGNRNKREADGKTTAELLGRPEILTGMLTCMLQLPLSLPNEHPVRRPVLKPGRAGGGQSHANQLLGLWTLQTERCLETCLPGLPTYPKSFCFLGCLEPNFQLHSIGSVPSTRNGLDSLSGACDCPCCRQYLGAFHLLFNLKSRTSSTKSNPSICRAIIRNPSRASHKASADINGGSTG